MLKLKSLRLSGIGRFVETQNIEFSTLGNLIQVDGENKNTGGSSGSGKSTLFNALDFLLGLNDLPTTVLQSRLTKEPISVRGEFDFDGKPLLITRNKRGLIIDLDNQVIEGSSKLAEEKLDQILGMPRDLFRKILHKRQKEGGFFLDFTPKKMYEFLTDCLNLASELKKLEKIENKLKELDNKKNTRQSHVMAIQSGLKATQESILALGLPPIRDIHQPIVLELKGKYDVSTNRFKEIEEKQKRDAQELEKSRPRISIAPISATTRNDLDKRKKELDDALSEISSAERDRVSRVRTLINEASLEQNKLNYQISDANTAKANAIELAAQVKKIRDSICPTCDQNWVTETAKTKENELMSKLGLCKERISSGVLASERQKTLASELLGLAEELKPVIDSRIVQINEEIIVINENIRLEKIKESEHMAKQNMLNNDILQKFADQQKDMQKMHSIEMEQIRGQLELDRRSFEAAVGKLKAYEEARSRYEHSLATMKDKEREYADNFNNINQELQGIGEETALAEELKIAVKSFISCSFDDALEAIGDAATKIIRCIPNMSNATIQFEGQKETKEGKVKEEVNAVISVDGEIGIPIKSLSGGERSSIDLAVDLAVIDFIETETGRGVDLMVLDEPFTGLDTINVEMALEVLKNSNTNKKLIIVDHNDSVKQMVSNRLVVVRDGSMSNVINQEVPNG